MRNLVLAALGLAATCCSRPGLPQGEWETVPPSRGGLDQRRLDEALAALGDTAGNVVVIRRGFLVARCGDVSTPLPVFSVSKSLTSLLVATLAATHGLALDEMLSGDNDERARPARISDYLSMRSGYGLPEDRAGHHFAYNNAAYHYLGREMATRYFENADPAAVLGEALHLKIGAEDGVRFTGEWGGWDGGFHLSARDLARHGLLLVRGGDWAGQQLIATEYVERLFTVPDDGEPSSSKAGSTDPKLNQTRFTQRMQGSYSYGWWISSKKDGRARCIRAAGRGGNFLILDPALDLVIAVTNDRPDGDHPGYKEYLAVVEGALL